MSDHTSSYESVVEFIKSSVDTGIIAVDSSVTYSDEYVTISVVVTSTVGLPVVSKRLSRMSMSPFKTLIQKLNFVPLMTSL